MAVVLDINMLCKKVLNPQIMEKVISDFGISVGCISCIDNWMWDNEQQIRDISQITEKLASDKIIVIKLIFPLIKDMGIYVEWVNNAYLYTWWLNAEGYPELDCDTITLDNKYYYEKAYQMVLALENSESNLLQIAGIGVETEFYCGENVIDIIHYSRNMTAWMLPSTVKADEMLTEYRKRDVDGGNKVIFEKVKFQRKLI